MEVFVILVITPCSSYLGGVFTNKDVAIEVCKKIFKERQKDFFYSDYPGIETNEEHEYSLYEVDNFEQSLLVIASKLIINNRID